MLIHIALSLSIIVLALFVEIVNSGNSINYNKIPNSFFIVPSFILIFIVSAFRGDFASDYDSYGNLFHLYNQYDFSNIFQASFAQEKGYILLSRTIGIFTDNELFLFIVTSFIILFAFFSQFKRYSHYIWLSVLLFVTLGPYYTSFNIMRQILAVALVFSGSKFLYERKAFKYFMVVAIVSLFHKSTLMMIPFYFILNLKFSFKNIAYLFTGAIVTMYFLHDIISFFQNFIYGHYTENFYGMTGLPIAIVYVPIAILIFSFIHNKKVNFKDTKQNIWFNAVIFYAFFNILGVQVQMVERLSQFFIPYILLFIPLVFYKMKKSELKIIYMVGLTLILFIYNYFMLKGSGFDPYYFIWSS